MENPAIQQLQFFTPRYNPYSRPVKRLPPLPRPAPPTSVVPHSFPSSKFTYDSPDFYVPYSNFNYAADFYYRYMYDTGYDPTLLSFPSLYGPRTAASPPPPPRTAEIPLENKTPARWPNVTNEILMRSQQSIEGTVDFDGQDLATLEQEARDSYYGTMPVWHLSGLPAPLRKGVSPRPLSNLAVSFENLTPSAWPQTVSEYMLDALPSKEQMVPLAAFPLVIAGYGAVLASSATLPVLYGGGLAAYYALPALPSYSMSLPLVGKVPGGIGGILALAGGAYVMSSDRFVPTGSAVARVSVAGVRGAAAVYATGIILQLAVPWPITLLGAAGAAALEFYGFGVASRRLLGISRAAIFTALAAMSPAAAFLTLLFWFGEFYVLNELDLPSLPEGVKDPLGALRKMAAEAAAAAAAAIREAAAAIAGAMGSVGAGLQSTIQQYLYYLLAALGVYVGYKVLTA